MVGLQIKMALPNTISDSELLERMMTGDEEAFLALYRRRQSGVYRFALQMSGSDTVAEDVTQEVFMTLIQEAGNYDAARGSLQAFLYGIARNFVLRKIAKENRFVALFEDADEGAAQASDHFLAASDPLGDLTRSETIERVRQAVLALPPRYREVVVLCDLHEMSYAEAAAALHCVVGTIRSRLHRARSLLAETLRSARQEEEASKIVSSRRSFVV
jgi:RNA polymerase sigma-70 factor (ECF subfamily)